MKENKRHIKYVNIPPRSPLTATAFWFMFIHYMSAPDWAYGVMGVLMAILWIGFIIDMCTKEAVDIFDYIDKRKP